MSRYWAEIDSNNEVLRVVVCDTLEWLQDYLGGTWIETRDPYAETQPDPSLEPVVYCGPGMGCDPTFPERFAPQWVPPYVDSETGQWVMPQKGDIRARHGRLWKSTVNNNAWEPGVSAWHDQPEIEGVLPRYVPVTGGHDTYPLGFELTHNDIHYINDRDNNDREPGTFDSGWRVFGEEPPGVQPWKQPGTVNPEGGVYPTYAIGEKATHDNPNDGGNIWLYRSKINANTTEPGRDSTFDRWWEPIRLA